MVQQRRFAVVPQDGDIRAVHRAAHVQAAGERDTQLARQMLERKGDLRIKEQQAMQTHMERIAEGVPETIATSSLHLDIIRDYRRINSYMTSAAYAILEEQGALRSSRLRSLDKA